MIERVDGMMWRPRALRLITVAALASVSGERRRRLVLLMWSWRRTGLASLAVAALVSWWAIAMPQTTDALMIRGKPQSLRLYGQRGNPPVIVSSGDGGWIHLGPHVAETLGSHGFFVVGVDVKSYLESFTSGSTTLQPDDEPRDYAALVAYAAKGSSQKPILVGVSEGAGLSVLAATDPATKAAIAGVIGLGLPNLNELGWRWRDSLIYLTHGIPKEPTFSTEAIIDRLAPTPFAAIHSTRDEFVPLAEVQRIVDRAKEPKRLWVIQASDHRFSDNLAEFDRRLLDAIAWVRTSARE